MTQICGYQVDLSTPEEAKKYSEFLRATAGEGTTNTDFWICSVQFNSGQQPYQRKSAAGAYQPVILAGADILEKASRNRWPKGGLSVEIMYGEGARRLARALEDARIKYRD
jgi:hypothetical protein